MKADQKSNSEKIAIYIDGGNFYQRLKDKEINFPVGVKFDYDRFIDFLSGGRNLVSKRYYIGVVRNVDGSKKSEKLLKSQQKFLGELEKEGFVIKRGKIVYNGNIREKGVDVKIATDLIIGAVDDLYDTAIIVSSDTDLIPAIKYIKYRGKKVEYVGFSHNPSWGMMKESTLRKLIVPSDVENFKKS